MTYCSLCRKIVLTPQQQKILQMIAEGRSNLEVAHELDLTAQTVKNHVSAAMRSLNAYNRTHAVVLAIRQGFLTVKDREEE